MKYYISSDDDPQFIKMFKNSDDAFHFICENSVLTLDRLQLDQLVKGSLCMMNNNHNCPNCGYCMNCDSCGVEGCCDHCCDLCGLYDGPLKKTEKGTLGMDIYFIERSE